MPDVPRSIAGSRCNWQHLAGPLSGIGRGEQLIRSRQIPGRQPELPPVNTSIDGPQVSNKKCVDIKSPPKTSRNAEYLMRMTWKRASSQANNN